MGMKIDKVYLETSDYGLEQYYIDNLLEIFEGRFNKELDDLKKLGTTYKTMRGMELPEVTKDDFIALDRLFNIGEYTVGLGRTTANVSLEKDDDSMICEMTIYVGGF